MKAGISIQFISMFLPWALLLLLLIGFAFLNVGFFEASNIYNICYAVSILIPVAIGMQLLLVTGYLDLSVGSIAALSGVVAAMLVNETASIFFAILGGLLVGITAGAINALIIKKLKIHFLLTTIATMGIFRALALIANDGMVVAGFPKNFDSLARYQIGGLEFPIVLGLFLLFIFQYLSVNSLPLRRFYQVGSDPVAAEICGLRVNPVIIFAFILCGLGASLTGLLGTSRSMAASATSSQTLGLDIITACVIGGSSLNGGRGTVFGAMAGLIILQSVSNVVILLGVSLYWRELVIGGVLILSIIANRYITKAIELRLKIPFPLNE